jgi:outer membrane protein assembly factor BamB
LLSIALESRLKLYLLRLILPALLLFALSWQTYAAESWSTKLDGRVRFYQSTELGVLIAGTEKSVYAIDESTGDILWRRKKLRLDENEVAPVPGTDLVLLSLPDGSKSRLEAVDVISGDTIWRTDKVRGAVMQMAVDQNSKMLAAVLVRDAKGHAHDGFKRKPVVHMFELASGDELWKYELESDIEMMPSRWSEGDDEVPFTLNNYHPPAFLDQRLYLFYEGLTSLDAATGKERRREKFRPNEEGFALTEADPVADESAIYLSGHGRVRAISRSSGDTIWEAKDLGTVPELILTPRVLYARTGGQFTRLKNGERVERGPYGVSAIEVETGKVLWRYKGADKGITNIALFDSTTVVVADHDDLIAVDTTTGKRRAKISHGIEHPSFTVLNERGEPVVGGENEIAAFDLPGNRVLWRRHHDPPGRGLLRTVAAIAARAAAFYLRYGATISAAYRGVQIVNAVNSLRWSGLATSVALPDLTTLASNYARDSARDYAGDRLATFGVLSRVNRTRYSSPAVATGGSRITREAEDRFLDRLDPARQLDRLSRFLLRKRRLATLRGQWMYFYTDLKDGRGLLGVNVNTGAPERAVRVSDPDERFIADEPSDQLFLARDDRMLAIPLNTRD